MKKHDFGGGAKKYLFGGAKFAKLKPEVQKKVLYSPVWSKKCPNSPPRPVFRLQEGSEKCKFRKNSVPL